MGYDFNAEEIFKMAEQIERNGGIFYRTAAESVEDAEAKAFLLSLAKMEDDHEKTFAGLRKSLPTGDKASTVFDPDGEAEQYLLALADTRIFFDKSIDTSSMHAILKDAITAEKDSIVFYLGMKDLVPDPMGKDKMDAIIREEMSHIKLLSRRLSAQK